jgi:hypothetical protein
LLLSKQYNGPISASIFIESEEEYHKILIYWSKYETLRKYVDIHIVYRNQFIDLDDLKSNWNKMDEYPVNYLRNIARKFSHTKFVLLIDADFYVPNKLRENVENKKIGKILKFLDKNYQAVLILPSYWNEDSNLIYPNDKNELINTLKINKKLTRCPFWSHLQTNFDFFEKNVENDFYNLPNINIKNDQEPYFIGHRYYFYLILIFN